MPPPARVNGSSDSHAAGRARQRLKLAAIGYMSVRHGIDADVESTRAGRMFLRKMAVEFVEALPGNYLKNRRLDLTQGDDKMLTLAAIAYASARHGIDADVGMSREGLALLCQASIDFAESLPREDQPKRSIDPHLQIGNGV